MKRAILLAACCSAIAVEDVSACDCFGNNSYCETLAPTYYLNPEATALVVKLSDYHYGITVKVVQLIGAGSLLNDTLMVWGDNGAICRPYLNWIAIGDTLVFGLNQTDFMGNFIWNSQYPPDLEQPGDYMLSVCGVYWLNYDDGLVNGPITSNGSQAMTLEEFAGVVESCSSANGISEPPATDPLWVRYDNGVPVLEMPTVTGLVELMVTDAQGRAVLCRGWNGRALQLVDMATGLYAVQVSGGTQRWVRKVLIQR